jgi:hypothetical protein
MATTTNWDALETEYITTKISLRELASKHGLSERQVFNRSRQGGWKARRDEWRSKVAAEVQRDVGEAAGQAGALVFKIAHYILSRYFEAISRAGMEFTTKDRDWAADIILRLEEAGKGKDLVLHLDVTKLTDDELDAIIARRSSVGEGAA